MQETWGWCQMLNRPVHFKSFKCLRCECTSHCLLSVYQGHWHHQIEECTNNAICLGVRQFPFKNTNTVVVNHNQVRIAFYINDIASINLSWGLGFNLEFWYIWWYGLVLSTSFTFTAHPLDIIIKVRPIDQCSSKEFRFYNEKYLVPKVVQDKIYIYYLSGCIPRSLRY